MCVWKNIIIISTYNSFLDAPSWQGKEEAPATWGDVQLLPPRVGSSWTPPTRPVSTWDNWKPLFIYVVKFLLVKTVWILTKFSLFCACVTGKEARKRELKKVLFKKDSHTVLNMLYSDNVIVMLTFLCGCLFQNKKQRMMVRAAVLKMKDPRQIIKDMEKLDEMGEMSSLICYWGQTYVV